MSCHFIHTTTYHRTTGKIPTYSTDLEPGEAEFGIFVSDVTPDYHPAILI